MRATPEEIRSIKDLFANRDFENTAARLYELYWKDFIRRSGIEETFFRHWVRTLVEFQAGGGELYPEYFNPSFARDYSEQLDGVRVNVKDPKLRDFQLQRFILKYLKIAEAIARGKRGDIFPDDFLGYQQYHKAFHGNFKGEPFSNYEISPQKIWIGRRRSSRAGPVDMVLVRAFKHYSSDRRRFRIFLAALWRGGEVVFF